MKFEHVAINVKDPVAMADWYTRNLNMTVRNALKEAPYTHFLADETGSAMLEIYQNPPDAVPDYSSQHPLQLHVAFVSNDPETDKQHLLEAGCTLFEDQHLEDGSRLVMLRDPWGFALQLCHRATPMIT